MPNGSRSYINVAVSGSQHMKLIKSVTSLVFKKVIAIVCGFLRKAPIKNWLFKRRPYLVGDGCMKEGP